MTIDDPARVAYVSKIVTALTVMRLVEAGWLTLDEDVSVRLGWRLRNPAFPHRPITLRQLLSHTSSVQDEGEYYIVRLGQRLQDVAQRPGAYDTEHAPGTFFRYSNLNFPIVASVLERATGERFDRLADRLVLKPLGLDACFNWTTCSDAAIARAVVLYEDDGSPLLDDLQGRRPECPVFVAPDHVCNLANYELGTNGALFSPQGGLRISARDLAVVGQLLLNKGRHGGSAFLQPESIAAMVRPHWTFNGANGVTEGGFYCSYGLGIQQLPAKIAGCNDDLLGDGTRLFGHAGEAYRVRSGLWLDSAKGRGVAFVAANNGKDPSAGRTAFRAIEEELAGKLRD
jgi:CubicO group peptidase (beta-lactamase class C family)